MPQVIPARVWFNILTGATASVRGAVPYLSDAQKDDWVIKTVGYSIQNDDGTIGQGRRPYATEAEAQAAIDANPHAFKYGPGA